MVLHILNGAANILKMQPTGSSSAAHPFIRRPSP